MKRDQKFIELIKKRESLYSKKRDSTVITLSAKADKYLVFSCNDIRMAVLLKNVEAIYPFREMNPFPLSQDFILGLFNHRGTVVPVLDLFHVMHGDYSNHSYIAVFSGRENILTGFTVTELLDLLHIEAGCINTVGINVHDNIKRFVGGELADGTLVLNTGMGGIL